MITLEKETVMPDAGLGPKQKDKGPTRPALELLL